MTGEGKDLPFCICRKTIRVKATSKGFHRSQWVCPLHGAQMRVYNVTNPGHWETYQLEEPVAEKPDIPLQLNCINFEGSNAFFGKPADWDESKFGPCATIPVLVTRDPMTCTTVWEFTPEQRQAVVDGATLALVIFGRQVPVALVLSDEFKKVDT